MRVVLTSVRWHKVSRVWSEAACSPGSGSGVTLDTQQSTSESGRSTNTQSTLKYVVTITLNQHSPMQWRVVGGATIMAWGAAVFIVL